MRRIRTIRFPALAFAAALVAGCGDPSGSNDNKVPEDELVFLEAASYAPPLERTEVSFWVTAGDNAEVEIDYLPVDGEDDGEKCLEFRIPGNALLRHPDGRPVRDGDRVLITIKVVDVNRFNFEFSPAGLQFDPDHPAELRVSYKWADPDFDNDGDVDEEDEEFDFGIWKQERVGEDWHRIGTARLHDLEEVRAEIEGFTRYAMAGN